MPRVPPLGRSVPRVPLAPLGQDISQQLGLIGHDPVNPEIKQ